MPPKPPLRPEDFGAGPVDVLLELDAVRKRPRMYVGDTEDGTGLHNLVYAIVDNAVAEAHANRIAVTLNADGSVTVSDDGRSLPTALDREEGISQAEILLTRLQVGRPSAETSYPASGALNGIITLSMVNALSRWLRLRIFQGGSEHAMAFFHGDPVAPLRIVGPALDRHGTEVTFLPASGAFGSTAFDPVALDASLSARAARPPGPRITFADARGETS